jgi:peptide chain release factor subunit 1
MLKELSQKFKNRKSLDLLQKLYGSGLIAVKVKDKREITTNKEFYDLYVPATNSFIANGIVVHNSQMRYDRLREDAINEFLTKIADLADEYFLKQANLKGILIGGPGPVKEKFVREEYLNYQLRRKILGVKDVGYTDEHGLEELVQRSQDLLKAAAIAKEIELMQKFFTSVQKNDGLAVYGYTETMRALEIGAVDTLLVSENFDWLHVNLRCPNGHFIEIDLPRTQAKGYVCDVCEQKMNVESERELVDELIEKAAEKNASVEIISTQTQEGRQFQKLAGVGALLRYKIS